MGYLYRPRLKDPTPLPSPKGKGCTHAKHGREETCPACGARFSAVWWMKYYVNGEKSHAFFANLNTERTHKTPFLMSTVRTEIRAVSVPCAGWPR